MTTDLLKHGSYELDIRYMIYHSYRVRCMMYPNEINETRFEILCDGLLLDYFFRLSEDAFNQRNQALFEGVFEKCSSVISANWVELQK